MSCFVETSLGFLSVLQGYPRTVTKNWEKFNRLAFVTRIIELLGNQKRNSEFFSSFQREYKDVSNAFSEMETAFYEKKLHGWDSEQYRIVWKLFQKASGIIHENEFHVWRHRFFSSFPFPQEILFDPTLKNEYQKVRNERIEGLKVLNEILEENFEEKKSSSTSRKNPDQILKLSKAYFNGRVFVYKGELYTVQDVFECWAQNSPAVKARLESYLPLKRGVVQAKALPKELAEEKRGPFSDFLLNISRLAVMKSLELDVQNEEIISYFRRRVNDSEVCSDLCYFLSHPKHLSSLRFDGKDPLPFKESSIGVLKDFQIFVFFASYLGVSEACWSNLCLAIVCRDPELDIYEEVPELKDLASLTPTKDPFFEEALYLFSQIIQPRLAQVDSFALIPSAFFKDPFALISILFLWKKPSLGRAFVEALRPLIARLGLETQDIYEFFSNHSTVDRGSLKAYVEGYLGVMDLIGPDKAFEARALWLPIERTGVRIENRRALEFWRAPRKTEEFMRGVNKYGFEKNQPYFDALRKYIHLPQPALFSLLEDAEKIGIEDIKPQVFNILEKAYGKMGVVTESIREKTIELFNRLEIALSDFQKISIYINFIRLISLGQIHRIHSIYSSIKKLEELDTLPSGVLFFLYRYLPEVSDEEIDLWMSRRSKWIFEKIGVQPLIDQNELQSVIKGAKEFSKKIANCPSDEDDQAIFRTQMEEYLVSLFLPFLQPVSDIFRLKIDGNRIVFKEKHLETHQGLFSPIRKGSSIFYFLRWLDLENKLVLRISFYNQKKKRMASETVMLNLPRKSLLDHFPNLMALAEILLKKEEEDERPKEGSKWSDHYLGAKKIVDEPCGLNFRTFLGELRVFWRRAYLNAAMDLDPPLSEWDPSKVAGKGNLYQVNGNFSLVPKVCMQPCFKEEALPFSLLREKFSMETKLLKDLDVFIEYKGEKQKVCFTVSDLENAFEEEKIPDGFEEVAFKEVAFGAFVTLFVENPSIQISLQYPMHVLKGPFFETQVEIHFLMLKSEVYRIQG